MNYTYRYDSPLGVITLASDGKALTGLWIENQKYFAATLPSGHEEKKLPIFDDAKLWLDTYFAGKKPDFTPELDPQTTEFRKLVCDILLTVPYSSTATYSQIAAEVARRKGLSSMSAHAVGNAVAHNPISIIIPCHRIVGVNGSLTGYAGGIDKKIKLLSLEGVDTSVFSSKI